MGPAWSAGGHNRGGDSAGARSLRDDSATGEMRVKLVAGQELERAWMDLVT